METLTGWLADVFKLPNRKGAGNGGSCGFGRTYFRTEGGYGNGRESGSLRHPWRNEK
jgi:hypothetical protein